MYNTMPLLLYPSTPGEQASLPEKGTGGGCESFAGQPEQAGSSCQQPIPVTGVSNDGRGADLINQGLEFLGDTNTCGDRNVPTTNQTSYQSQPEQSSGPCQRPPQPPIKSSTKAAGSCPGITTDLFIVL